MKLPRAQGSAQGHLPSGAAESVVKGRYSFRCFILNRLKLTNLEQIIPDITLGSFPFSLVCSVPVYVFL